MNGLILSALALPLLTAALLMLFRRSLDVRTARWIALCGAIITLLLSLGIAAEYQNVLDHRAGVTASSDPAVFNGPVQPKIQFSYQWLTFGSQGGQTEPVRVEFLFGLDGISVALILLTTVLTISCVLISWESIQDRAPEFYTCLLLLQSGLIGVFCSFDLLLFYVFFEFTLLPLFFLVGIWGGPQRRYAAVKLFLYTLAGGLVTLVGLVGLVMHAAEGGLSNPFSIPSLAAWLVQHPMELSLQVTLFLALAAGFLVKVPVFPFHTWLPLAHTEAPTAGSVLLAGVLLKLGTYGFLRLCLPMFPDACQTTGFPLIATLSVIGIIYGSLCALSQRDIKKLVAYSSVAHMGFCMLGMFALNTEGLTGGILQMINHGLSTGALFLLVGMVYDRYHTRKLDDLGGLASRLPLIAVSMVFIAMASIGLPGLNGFVSEMLALIGMFKRHPLYAAMGATGVVLGAWYTLTMVQQAFFGELKEPRGLHGPIHDMSWREFTALAPLAALCLWIGLFPQSICDLIEPDVRVLVTTLNGGPGTQSTAEVSRPVVPVAEQPAYVAQSIRD